MLLQVSIKLFALRIIFVTFKKPGAGMLIVIKDMVLEEFGLKITP